MKTLTKLIYSALTLAWFALSPKVQAVVPPPDGGYPGWNTAEGTDALFSLTPGVYYGIENTALGGRALYSNTIGNSNTAVGLSALYSNTAGSWNTATGSLALKNNTANYNTANGSVALYFNTTGEHNTAAGFGALYSNTTGNDNTVNGFVALSANTFGSENTATGYRALEHNTSGSGNTATGSEALNSNTMGFNNTAIGGRALESNTTGILNTAIGGQALKSNTRGQFNTATGTQALENNTTGQSNTAAGNLALYNNATGHYNTATGDRALRNNIGNNNTALGSTAGFNATTGNGNVYIGAGMLGVAGENDHTYIRNIKDTTVSGFGSDTVTVNIVTGLLGRSGSSHRYKEDIQPMDKASETLFGLKPVTFRYKKEIDQSQSLDYGLIAEEVAKVDPNLAVRDGKGQIESVRYTAINAMLLNEFLKEHRKVERLKKNFESNLAEQQTQIEALSAGLQKVSAQIEMSKLAPHVAVNSP